MFRMSYRLAGGFALFSIFGCGGLSIPLSKTHVIPTGVASNAEELVQKVNNISKDTHYAVVMTQLNINRKTPNVGELIKAKDKQELLDGNIQFTPNSLKEAEEHRDKMSRTRITFINFDMTNNPVVLDSFVSAQFPRRGEALTVYLVFFDDKFQRAILPNNYVVDENRRVYITDGLRGAITGGMGRGINQIGK